MAEGEGRRLGSVRKKGGGLLEFLFVWGKKVSNKDGHITEVMREMSKEVMKRLKKDDHKGQNVGID